MDLETLIVAVFCLVDDFVRDLCHDRRLRQRGPTPVLADSEVLTVEIVGEFLGLDTDRGLHAYFRRHYGHLFPRLRQVHRTTFARQAANLWVVKHAPWRRLAAMAAARRAGGARPPGDAHRQHAGAGPPLRPRAPLPQPPRPERVRV